MKFDPELIPATFLRRYKRFLADVRLSSGEEITVHCANTGSMKNCLAANTPCWLHDSENCKRKYQYTLEMLTTPADALAGVNTARPNALVEEAIHASSIPELQGYEDLQREVKYGEENSRIDILLTSGNRRCYVEVKSVTLALGDGLGAFPDSVSVRGTKHLRELQQMVVAGHRAVLLFCVQHSGIDRFSPADDIDPLYGKTLREAMSAGVEVLVYRCHMSARENVLRDSLPLLLS